MRDADARERLDALERALESLPAQVTEVVVAHFEPVISEVNSAIVQMNDSVQRLEVIAAAVAKLEGHGELMDVIESELNALRVDVNAGREATAAVVKQVGEVTSKLALVGKAFSDVGSKT